MNHKNTIKSPFYEYVELVWEENIFYEYMDFPITCLSIEDYIVLWMREADFC
jgi:hypothetical protein